VIVMFDATRANTDVTTLANKPLVSAINQA
jgi:hypothetical protein